MTSAAFDDDNQINTLANEGLRSILREMYQIANALHEAGFWGTEFSADVYNHRLGFRADLYCKPHEESRFSIDLNFYKTKYTISFSNGSKRTLMPDELDAESLIQEIRNFVDKQLTLSFGTKFTSSTIKPVQALIKTDKDPYDFAQKVKDQVLAERGIEIFLFDDHNAPEKPPEPEIIEHGFFSRLGMFLGLVTRPAPPPPPALNPSIDDLPAYITELPKYLETNIAQLQDDDLKTEANRALKNVKTAISLVRGRHSDRNLSGDFKIAGSGKLKQDLAIINNGIKEFNFSNPPPELSRYFAMVNNLLESQIESKTGNKVGIEVAVQKLESRGLNL